MITLDMVILRAAEIFSVYILLTPIDQPHIHTCTVIPCVIVTTEREHAQALEVEHSRQQMEAAITERNQLQDKLRGLQTELDSANEGLEAAHRLSEQLDRREEVIRALKEEGRYCQLVGESRTTGRFRDAGGQFDEYYQCCQVWGNVLWEIWKLNMNL